MPFIFYDETSFTEMRGCGNFCIHGQSVSSLISSNVIARMMVKFGVRFHPIKVAPQ